MSEEDRRIENAKWGVGIAALLGTQNNKHNQVDDVLICRWTFSCQEDF